MITPRDLLRALQQALTHPSNPAILRLPESERTVEGILRAYLPGSISQRLNGRWFPVNVECITRGGLHGEPLDLSDPGTACAVLVVLALALGLDPGVSVLEVTWSRRDNGGYIHCSRSGNRTFDFTEPDPIKALALALLHVCPRETA